MVGRNLTAAHSRDDTDKTLAFLPGLIRSSRVTETWRFGGHGEIEVASSYEEHKMSAPGRAAKPREC